MTLLHTWKFTRFLLLLSVCALSSFHLIVRTHILIFSSYQPFARRRPLCLAVESRLGYESPGRDRYKDCRHESAIIARSRDTRDHGETGERRVVVQNDTPRFQIVHSKTDRSIRANLTHIAQIRARGQKETGGKVGHLFTAYPNVDVHKLLFEVEQTDYSHVSQCAADTYLAVFIHIAQRNSADGQVMAEIRDYWKAHKYERGKAIKAYFLVGRSPYTRAGGPVPDPKRGIAAQSDVILVNVTENYDSLTLKTISMVKWISVHCTNAKYILKMDDDVFVNIAKLMDFLAQVDQLQDRKLMLGRTSPPHRVPKGGKAYRTWRITKEVYPLNMWPTYTEGCLYIFTGNLVPDLVDGIRAVSTPVVNIEDIFLTGIVRVMKNITVAHSELIQTRCSPRKLVTGDALSVHHYDIIRKRCGKRRHHMKKPNGKTVDTG